MGKVVVTFKLEEEVYSKLRNMTKSEGRGVSGILREALTDWLGKKKSTSASDFIAFIKEQKNNGKTWVEISFLLLARYGISLSKDQLKSLSKMEWYYNVIPLYRFLQMTIDEVGTSRLDGCQLGSSGNWKWGNLTMPDKINAQPFSVGKSRIR